jgi:hypothetical protein
MFVCIQNWQAARRQHSGEACRRSVPFTRAVITYNANFASMTQQRSDGIFGTERRMRRMKVAANCQPAPPVQFTNTTVHALASEPLALMTQPTVVVAATAAATATTATVGTAAAATAATTALVAATATCNVQGIHKYELSGAMMNTYVTLDNVMYSIAAALYTRHRTSSRCATVRQVDVYSNPVTRAKYDAKRQQFAAQGISTAETWVFHGTTCTANVHRIMTEGFKVCNACCCKLL